MIYELSITDFSNVGGIHFYGNIYSQVTSGTALRFEHELHGPVTEGGQTWDSIRFHTMEEVVVAARKWLAENAAPNSELVIVDET